MPVKASLYARETYFREGLADAEEVLGGGPATVLHGSALIMLKPDGMLTGRLAPVLSFLEENDFQVVAAEEVVFTPLLWREMWRYQLTSATLDRLAVNEHVYGAAPALLLALRDRRRGGLPGTVRLSGIKGSSDPAAQLPGTLRSRLGQPSRILSRIHVADEPADLVREFGLLFAPATRRRLLSALATGRLSERDRDVIDAALARQKDDTRSPDPAGPLGRAADAVRDAAARHPDLHASAARAARALDGIRAGQEIAWRAFTADLAALGLRLPHWDLAVLGSVSVRCDEPGEAKVIGNPEPGIWERNARTHA